MHLGVFVRRIPRSSSRHMKWYLLLVAALTACGGTGSSCHGFPPPPGANGRPATNQPQNSDCHLCHSATVDVSNQLIQGGRHANGTVDVVLAPRSCGTCHGVPPRTGEHREHVDEGIACSRCHGTGYSRTAVGASHLNGAINLTSTTGWSSGSCSPSCHERESWGTRTSPVFPNVPIVVGTGGAPGGGGSGGGGGGGGTTCPVTPTAPTCSACDCSLRRPRTYRTRTATRATATSSTRTTRSSRADRTTTAP